MPPYPLYGETTPIPGTNTLHTHSNKFPIEREVILSSADKNTKIPILQEYRRRERNKTMAAISPDGPSKLVAWTATNNTNPPVHSVHLPETPLRPHQTYLTSPHPGMEPMKTHQATYVGGPHTGAVPRTYEAVRSKLPGDHQVTARGPGHDIRIPGTEGRSAQQEGRSLQQETRTAHIEMAALRISIDTTVEQTKMDPPQHGPPEVMMRRYPTELDPKTSADHIATLHSDSTDSKGDSDKNKAFPTRTYHTLKGMISSRFNKTSKEPTDTSLNKSNSSLLEAVALNNMEKDVNKNMDNMVGNEGSRLGEEGMTRLGHTDHQGEGQYARVAVDTRLGPGLGTQVVYAKVLDQNSGQCVVNVDGNMAHPTNQSLYSTNAQPMVGSKLGSEMIKTQGQPLYSDRTYRSTNTSQYAKPNTQQSYQDQSTGIYMVMRQGGPQYPGSTGERMYQAEPGKVIPQSATNPIYAQHSIVTENGVHSNEQGQHLSGNNQSANYSQQQYPKPGQGGMNVYQAHKIDQSGGSSNLHEHLSKSGPIGPSLIYQQQHSTTPKMNGTPSSYYTSGNTSREVNHYSAKETKSSCDRIDDVGKDVYSSNDDAAQVGEYSCKDDNGGIKKGVVNRDEKGVKDIRNGGFRKSKFGSSGIGSGSGQSSDYDKTNVDSGRGSAISGQQIQRDLAETSEESSTTQQGNDSEWVDLVESELRQILDPHAHHQNAPMSHGGGGNNSTISDSISSMTPPLPPLSPGGGNTTRYKLSHNSSGIYGIKQDYGPIDGRKTSQSQGRGNMPSRFNWSKSSDRHKSLIGGSVTDITSTTGTGLDSLLDDDVTTSIATGDARAIRHQLEGLENMYSQVLQLLGVKRQGMKTQGYQPSDPRFSKRRFHGSVSSVPSSVSSRPIRDKRRQDERKKVKDIKGINKRFQRLESHVVTLARSVAHLSSEMRTQHLMIQEMENIRSELSALRSHTMAVTNRSQSMPRLTAGVPSLPALTNPTRVKKLTKFFGDEPPLLRLFLKKLGYEKYAAVFESERVGMVELPYMSEERLQSMGIPLGPRLRILQEAHVSVLTTEQLCVL